ncbi:methyltransferase domain-containing protein [Dyella sp. LX-66]|uniref:class I SAM-dependent methyltransferase n=1 Tax=unclassified Dyella TaxID=2634549 RepID=UPI001BE00BF0|nr:MULTISPECIES: class I SAM-dependent methyltransferase [unclassified Dyella]MBT2117213.1 methyltransferase domain-containing protein [Dyella sp. LX-1]MBT2138277.1 methyltransferase domain-containing protein [Dyella sp. LX-66]
MQAACPICQGRHEQAHFGVRDGYDYYACAGCDSLYIDPTVLAKIDEGHTTREYDADYWNSEIASAHERAQADGLICAGETILYTRRPVRRFLDVGAGPGYLLDELALRYPARPDTFHAVELFPPEERSQHPNYVVGDVGSLDGKFDAGVCIEVVEHLTPRMLDGLVAGLAKICNVNSAWLFNTGMPAYVREQDPDYLDPKRRGHIVSYGLKALRRIFEPHGFRVLELPGKTFAFLVEYQADFAPVAFDDRFYNPLPENLQLMKEAPLVYIAAFESARSYFFQDESKRRAYWALGLQGQLEQLSLVR